MIFKSIAITCCVVIHILSVTAQAQYDAPFKVDNLFDLSQPETLGLSLPKNIETITIFAPGPHDKKYNHGVVLFPFKGMLYAQWQSSTTDEDAPDTQVFCSRSTDGIRWSKPQPLTHEWNGGIKTNGGWWSYGDTLIAYINVWPANDSRPKEGYTEFITSVDGEHWSSPAPVTSAENKPVLGIIEQDVHSLPDGRLITAFHRQPGLIATPFYTDDRRGISGWTAGQMKNMSVENDVSRELEPAWFYRSDDAIVMVFRDQSSTYKKVASVSRDRGVTWTDPVIVDTPDSRAKQSAGNLPDGTAFMVNNPSGNKNRFPLAIALSTDGFVFNKAFLLRSGGNDLQPLRYAGKYKRPGYSYPKSVVWGEYLYVSYATNKEDVEVTRVPLVSLEK